MPDIRDILSKAWDYWLSGELVRRSTPRNLEAMIQTAPSSYESFWQTPLLQQAGRLLQRRKVPGSWQYEELTGRENPAQPLADWLTQSSQELSTPVAMGAALPPPGGKAPQPGSRTWYSALRAAVERKAPPVLETLPARTVPGRTTPMREAYNPKTGETILIPPKTTPEKVYPAQTPLEQLKGILKGESVTAAEWEKSGLEKKLLGGKYTKQEILKYIDESTPELEDVMLGEPAEIMKFKQHKNGVWGTPDGDYYITPEEGGEYSIRNREGVGIGIMPGSLEQMKAHLQEWYKPTVRPKFGAYVEPGGTNYREMFVTAPTRVANPYTELDAKDWFAISDSRWNLLSPSDKAAYVDKMFQSDRTVPRWRDGHADYADIENPIVRLRFNTRTTTKPPDPKLVAELDAVTKELNDVQKQINIMDGEYRRTDSIKEFDFPSYDKLVAKGDRLSVKAKELQQAVFDSSKGDKVLFLEEMQPPSEAEQAKMPPELLKRWRELGMKRAVKYALDNGFDRVAWTTGEMQVQRYENMIRKVVGSIHVGKIKPNEYADVTLFDPHSNYIPVPKGIEMATTGEYRISVEDMQRVFGKEMTRTIMTGKQYADYEGKDLKVGGEGLKKIYDEDLPNVAKGMGAKMGTTEISLSHDASLNERFYNTEKALATFRRGREVYGVINGHEQLITSEKELLETPWASFILGDKQPNAIVPSIDLTPIREIRKKGFPIYAIPLAVAGANAVVAKKRKKQKE